MLVKKNMLEDENRGAGKLVFPPGNLSEFDGSPYPDLVELDCSARNCEEMDLLDNGKLENLNCSVNSLSRLDLSGCTSLTHLDCSFNFLQELVLPPSPRIEILDCSHNNLTELDLGNAPDIREVYCDANESLSSLLFPSCEGEPVIMEFLDISHTALDSDWLENVRNFPLPEEGCEDQLFVFGTPLAENIKSLAFLRSLGWFPVVEEE